jgi:hypothetical protein
MIAPQYTRELSPASLRPLFGSFFSLGRITGIVFCYLLGLIFQLTNTPSYWRIMFAIPGALAIIQAILIKLYVPASPIELAENQDEGKLRRVITKIYK